MEKTAKKRDGKNVFKLPSASKVERQILCPASVVLPKVESINPFSTRGTGGHFFFEKLPLLGRERALALTPPDAREIVELVDVNNLPWPEGCTSEVALAYDVMSGKGRLIGTSIGRNYGERGEWEMFGSADLFKKEETHAHVYDLKFVSGHDAAASPPDKNWQTRSLALAASRAFGCDSATVGIIKVFNDGRLSSSTHEIDIFGLDEAAATLRKFGERASRDWEAYSSHGVVPTPVEGDHCRFCPSVQHCPAKTALLRAAASDPLSIEAQIDALNPSSVGEVWRKLVELDKMVWRAKQAIQNMAEQSPIPLPNGKMLTAVEVNRESVDGAAAFEALSELAGREVANAAIEINSSKEAIKRALRPIAQTRGVPLASLEREVLGTVRARGGIKTGTQIQYREVANSKNNS